MTRERRIKVIPLGTEYLRSLIQVPEGAHIVRVDYDYMRECINVQVAHPDFEDVPPFAEPPMIFGEAELVRCENKKFDHVHLKFDWEVNDD